LIFKRTITTKADDFASGDIVTWNLPGGLTHIGIVSDKKAATGTPLVLHNIGSGTQEEDILFAYQAKFAPPSRRASSFGKNRIKSRHGSPPIAAPPFPLTNPLTSKHGNLSKPSRSP
jgi:hypothetical protein